ncbi:methylated-DNA--[protein]-cysteine S-methyltransferase [Minwuia sp.]|uniref:methylated-DNA--[protein]-cysteine S-methyltransferase n=1 Tax=Minwuia sp. TaxID=2493630 RepID=UPI003A924BF0
MEQAIIDSPLGRIRIEAEDGAITRLRWTKHDGTITPPAPGSLLARAADQLAEYFAGKRDTFDLPVSPSGTTFQRAVWDAMVAIPKGGYRTYGDVAGELGASARSVGTACGANPIPVIIPCHRILAAGGRLGGFSAEGGVEDKVWLLRHEGALL